MTSNTGSATSASTFSLGKLLGTAVVAAIGGAIVCHLLCRPSASAHAPNNKSTSRELPRHGGTTTTTTTTTTTAAAVSNTSTSTNSARHGAGTAAVAHKEVHPHQPRAPNPLETSPPVIARVLRFASRDAGRLVQLATVSSAWAGTARSSHCLALFRDLMHRRRDLVSQLAEYGAVWMLAQSIAAMKQEHAHQKQQQQQQHAVGGHGGHVVGSVSDALNRADPDWGYTPVMSAARSGRVNVLKMMVHDEGASVASRDHMGRTAAMFAAEMGHADALQIVLDGGGAIDATDRDGWTPAMFASANGRLSALQLLVRKSANLHLRDAVGYTALTLAVSRHHKECAKLLLTSGCELTHQECVDLNIPVRADIASALSSPTHTHRQSPNASFG